MYGEQKIKTSVELFDFNRVGRVFCFISLPLLNALLCPIIIIYRSGQLRRKVVGIVCRKTVDGQLENNQ